MALYALDAVGEAFEITRDFLTDVGRRTWLKLAFVVFFVGGAGGSFPTTNFGTPTGGTDPGTTPGDGVPPFDPGAEFWLIVGLIALAVVLVILALSLVGAIMEFVFVESLRSQVVSVREYWSRRWRQGVRLFVFRLVLGLVLLSVFAVAFLLVVLPFVFETSVLGASLLLLLLMIPVFVVLAVVLGLVGGFTTTFVVPIMILEDCGVLAGWRRLWPTIKAQWTQYLAYVVVSWLLSFAAGIFVLVVVGVLAVVLLVPFGALGLAGFALMSTSELAGIAVVAVAAVLFGLSVLVVGALANVPVQTYLRYYALLVLGDVEDDFDIVPEYRAAVRDPDESDGSAAT